MPRAFFFPHPKRPGPQPGRTPFAVKASVVSAQPGLETEGAEIVVCADGYGLELLGSNQDPCVFCSPGPPFLSFCRIDDRAPRHHLAGTKQLLVDVVGEGDLILFGKYEPAGRTGPTERIWLDTVLVVAGKPLRWTTSSRIRVCGANCRRRKWTLKSPSEFAERLTGSGPGQLTDAYRYNLLDAEPGGHHCCTNLADYRVITGRVEASSAALVTMRTSFVPLAERDDAGEWQPASVGPGELGADTWADVSAVIDGVIRGGVRGPARFKTKGAIAEFPSFALALELCAAIAASSGGSQGRTGFVAIPPLVPLAARRRPAAQQAR